jgi:sigma-E factor negative regulatory protein RseC
MNPALLEQARPDGLIEGQARVVAVDGSFVWLATTAPAACGSCASSSACSPAHATANPTPATQWRAPRTLGHDSAPLALGETVRVGVDRQALTRAAWAAYALPLLAMLAAAVALQGAGDAAAAAAAVAGLLLGALAARQLVRRWQSRLTPVVLGRDAPHTCTPVATVVLSQVQRPRHGHREA